MYIEICWVSLQFMSVAKSGLCVLNGSSQSAFSKALHVSSNIFEHFQSLAWFAELWDPSGMPCISADNYWNPLRRGPLILS